MYKMWIGGLLIALGGALAAVKLGLPLPWMLGALLATAATRISGSRTACPRPARYGGQWVIGTSLGLYFTPQVVAHIGAHWIAIGLGIVAALVLGMMGTAMLYRYAQVDLKTAWFASAIGGASEMVSLAEQHGARLDRVATAHSLRVLIIVCTVPFLFQAWGVAGLDPTVPGAKIVHLPGLFGLAILTLGSVALFRKLEFPSPWVLGSMTMAMVVTYTGHDLSALPQSVLNAGQLLIGWSLGDRYRPDFFKSAPRFMGMVAVFTVVSLLLAALFSVALAYWVEIPLPVLMLGTTPGGIAEMAITAKALQLGTPVVTAFHVTRMVAVVVVTGPIYKTFIRPRTAGLMER